MPKLRQNPLTGDWVIIAPERAARPEDFAKWQIKDADGVKAKDCVFCPGNRAYKEKIEGLGTEYVYVIPNRYPALVMNEHIVEEGHGLYSGGESIGAHEVIVMERHKDNLFKASKPAIFDLFKVFQQRYRHYGKDPDINYVMAINNQREEAGASIEHAHSQLLASSIVPPLVKREFIGCRKYYLAKGRCLMCDIIKLEAGLNERVVDENEEALAITPFAPRFPFEIWLVPKIHESDFRHEQNINEFSELFGKIMTRLRSKLGIVPLNFYIHSCPTWNDVVTSYHWHLEITPRLARLGGYEIGGDTFIDVMSPEKAAMFLKK